MLDGKLSEAIMLGETSDISQFYDFELYEWIKLQNNPVPFPEYKPVLGRYLGSSVYVVP